MSYKIKRNKYLTLKLLERIKNKVNEEIIISDEEFNYLKNNFDESLECESVIEKYYWYVGQTQPTSQDSITPQDDAPFTMDNWHTIDDINNIYSFSNPLYNSVANPISGNGGRTSWYVAFPSISSLSLYDSDKLNEINYGNWNAEEQITVEGVTYNVYKSVGGYPHFNGFWIY